jgi:hypothetical protein
MYMGLFLLIKAGAQRSRRDVLILFASIVIQATSTLLASPSALMEEGAQPPRLHRHPTMLNSKIATPLMSTLVRPPSRAAACSCSSYTTTSALGEHADKTVVDRHPSTTPLIKNPSTSMARHITQNPNPELEKPKPVPEKPKLEKPNDYFEYQVPVPEIISGKSGLEP